ncbi:mitochondrial amidoxime-reducing component 1 isoform X1 [Neoarius graeffei]|uniref:mitochondrial amidoxime-reducing component 1 isoform X1 n=1 Tax=Neoarius graeffei TaxID=443677 RepID=UPI00298C1E86|nr:mitochondrial amidoxime-reducing component 1 isoform X1 [Neoarius graeffei]
MDFLVKLFSQNRKIAFCITGAAAVLLGLAFSYKYTRRQKKFTRVGVVLQLFLHPMKSGKAVCVPAAECLRMGLKCGDLRDRHWLVITEDGHMVTGRQQPRLVLVSLTCEGGQICLNAPEMEELRFPLHQSTNRIFQCRVFSSDTEGRDCGNEVSDWLTRYLAADKTFRLVHYEPHLKARTPPEKGFPQDEKVAYPDAAPVMLMSVASLNDLSSKLDSDVSICRFRPNIVASDCEPFSEDLWDHVQIGQVEMQRVMGCGRCIFTTVDPETGIITRKEPLATLKTYRLTDPAQKTAPIFGQYYTIKKMGILHVGDPIYRISY